METKSFYDSSVGERMRGSQPAAARAIITGGVFETALRIVLFIGYRLVAGDEINQRDHGCK